MDGDGTWPPTSQQPTLATAAISSPRAPAALRHVSADAFLAATCIAWSHLQPAERKAIRACCRAGRLQHDRLLSHLRLTLGPSSPDGSSSQAPTILEPHQLRDSLHGVLGRGARLQSLAVRFGDSRDGRREAQLLAALESCCACPVATLALEGAVPLSGATATAVDACCPHLSALRIEHEKKHPPPEWEVQLTTNIGYQLGCIQLLALCGPRLRELRLLGVHRWQALSYMALNRCTALVSLELEAGWRPARYLRQDDEDFVPEQYLGDLATEVHVLETVAQLRTLRSLDLCINLPDSVNSATADVRPLLLNAPCVAQLSALTALTRLRLVMSECYEHAGDSYFQNFGATPENEAAWAVVKEAHRAALLAALHCMPQLQQLHCPTLWLAPGGAAPLTALTSLALAGLIPPPLEQQLAQPAAGGSLRPSTHAAGVLALPPQLRELVVLNRASPRVLALLQPPLSFAYLEVDELSFGTADVTSEGRLRAEAVAAVGPAVRLLLKYRGKGSGYRMAVAGDGGPRRLQPREGSPDGHMEWIRQLKGLDVCGSLHLAKIELGTGDLYCLAQTLPRLAELVLWKCSFPVAALPVLRGPMRHLSKLEVDFQHCGPVERGVLEAVLLQLCRPPHGGGGPLKQLTCTGIQSSPSLPDIMEARASVAQQLADCFGVTDVDIEMRG